MKDELDKRGLARGTRAHTAFAPHCQRCETVVEPMLSLQWFVRTAPLAGPAIEAVEQGQTRFDQRRGGDVRSSNESRRVRFSRSPALRPTIRSGRF